MNKSDLIKVIAEVPELSKQQAELALKAFCDAITSALKSGDKVTLPELGTFSITKRAERPGRNPRTGEEMTIKARSVAKFKPGKALSDAVADTEYF